MRISDYSLPYPVLSIVNDDVLPQLGLDCISMPDPVIEKKRYYFSIDLKIENSDILHLVETGKAIYSCEVSCAKTYLRRCETSNNGHFEFSLSCKEVYGRIEFHCYITVIEDIPGYVNSGFNPDYEDASFDMEPGDVLAVFPTAHYNASIAYEKLYAAGSYMTVLPDEKAAKTWIQLDKDQIVIFLPQKLYDQFTLLNNDRNFQEVFHASIVFQALYYALSNYDEDDYGNSVWAESIKYRIQNEEALAGMDIEDTDKAFELAQKLLDDPYSRLFEHLQKPKTDQ